MKKNEEPTNEPLGIVISGGAHVQSEPRFRMYMWAPAPEEETEVAAATIAA